MNTHFSQKNKKSQKGFVVLFAVLISAVVLAITLGISNVAYKEVVLTSQAREANYAFFAADSGSECALYADFQKSAFGTPGDTSTSANFDCNGTTVSPSILGNQLTFDLDFTNSENDNTASCAKVTVDKDVQKTLPDGTTGSYTQIESLGYNANCTAVDNLVTNPNLRIVERAIRVTYQNDVVAPPVTP